jgi:hypothetical protein
VGQAFDTGNLLQSSTLPGSAEEHVVTGVWDQSGWYYRVWQSFAVLTPVRSVGVMGDFRTYGYMVAVRAVRIGGAKLGDTVAIVGGGSIGLLCLQVAVNG